MFSVSFKRAFQRQTLVTWGALERLQAEKAECKTQELTHPGLQGCDLASPVPPGSMCDLEVSCHLGHVWNGGTQTFALPTILNGNYRNVSREKNLCEGTALAFSFLCSIEFLYFRRKMFTDE